jgi:RNA polymerase sigma-70 factor (ECF subfamily)
MAPRSERFERIYHAHYAAVLAYALRRAPRPVADDVVAETFLVAWRRLDDVPADPAPWLYGVARRVLANERRASGRRAALVERLTREPSPAPVPDASPGALEETGAALAVQSARTEPFAGASSDSVKGALAALTEREREALTLVAWDGLNAAQAARAAGCSHTAMRVRLHRARRRFAAALETRSAAHESTEEAIA